MQTQRISKRQALLVAVTTIVGGVQHPLFRDLLLWSGNGAWAGIILSVLASMVIFLFALSLAKRFPKQSIASYLPKIWGKVVGYPLVILFLLGFFFKAVYILRHVSEFFVSVVLPETPISAVMLVLLILSAAGILAELEGLVRFNELVFPIVALSFAWVLVASIPSFSGWELLPLFDRGLTGLPHTFALSLAYPLNLALILFIFPLISDQERITRETMKMLAVAGIFGVAISLNIILTLGAPLGATFTWPYLALVENVPIGTERSEALFMIAWMLAAFVSISLFIYIVALGLHQLFPKVKRSWLGLGLLLPVAFLALMSDNQPMAVISHLMANRYALFAFSGIPILSLAVAAIRGQRETAHE